MHPGAQATSRRGFEPDVAAVAARHVAGDRQAETDAPGGRVARSIEADERPEHAVAVGRRDPRTVVIDENIYPVGDSDTGQPDLTTIPARVADQIGKATP